MLRHAFFAVTSSCLALVSLGQTPAALSPKPVKVAFLISDRFNVMDFAGAWEVFGDSFKDKNALYEVYTVAESNAPIHSVGGMIVTPSYTFADAPKPDLVVIGAQKGSSPATMDWLRKQNAQGVNLMSVCTGASKLAEAGLLDGKEATTHHEYIAGFQQRYPKTKWLSSKRYVRVTPTITTSGGLTSGIDLALHTVAEQFGEEVATATARYMEYEGDGWHTKKLEATAEPAR
jgi:transcriptional regulator GlxA family with amidase domain